jgi:hypothetical protein
MLTGTAGAQGIPSYGAVRGNVAFDAEATLGDFTGTSESVAGRVVGAAAMEGVRGWVEFPAASLRTGNGKRDRDMRSSLEVDRFPVIRFELDAIGAGTMSGDSIPVTLRGRFTIHGVTRTTAVRGWAWVSATAVRFRGSTPMSLPDHDIGGLSKAFGLLKMQPDIVVRMDLTFTN